MSAAEFKAKAGEAFKANDFETAASLFTQAIALADSDHTLYGNR
jgi:hypothetical protein